MADDTKPVMVPFEKPLVDAVDSIIAFANKNGSRRYVNTSKDWDTIRYIFQIWKTLFPDEFKRFSESVEYFREYQESSIAKENTAMVQHKMEIPQHLHQMVKVIFKEQQWDKPFLNKMVETIPELKTE
ncbi:MAG: hypothetical protein C5B59_12885 [Bacteroidetes bacterium]|nr:MAG: hypothetical protein C5B59_12885 [Bacteroidota bacterium]